MACEPLYRRIPEKGKHPANSKRNQGAISGAALDDETNKPSGSSDFMPVNISESDYLKAQQKATFWWCLTEMCVDYVSERFQYWWRIKALPTIFNEILPSAKDNLIKWNRRRKENVEQSKKSINMTTQADKGSVIVALPADFESAYQNYTVNMSSESAQKELFEAFVLQYLSMKKIQKLFHARIVDVDGNVIDGSEVVKKLSNPTVIRSINQLLFQNPSLLHEWQAKALAESLGRDLVQNDQFVPIRERELLMQTGATDM